jgi:hypothetical protein
MAKRYHVSRHIDAPVERVWALLTDSESYRAWNRAVVSIEGPITEGATISLVPIITRTIPDMTDSFNQFADGLKTAAEAIPGDPSRPS